MKNKVYIGQFCEKGIRENNEDFIASVNDCFIVCDGMGGHLHGEIASQTVAESLCSFFQNLPTQVEKGNLQAALNFALECLNKKDVFDNIEHKMGTTVVLAALTESSVLVGHVGDSRLYHIRPNIGLMFRTKDHSQVQEWLDNEIITEEEARVHPKKNLITRCIQPHSLIAIELEINELKEVRSGDYLFLCTDGVVDAMTDQEITSIISKDFFSDKDRIEEIKKICTAKSKDNFSGFLIQIEKDIEFKLSDNKLIEESNIHYPIEKQIITEFIFCPTCGRKIIEDKQEEITFKNCFIDKILMKIEEWAKIKLFIQNRKCDK